MTTADIVAGIDRRITEAKAEIAQLERARETLADTSAGAERPIRRSRPRKTAARKRGDTATAIVPAGKLTGLLDGSPGMSTAELARTTNGRPAQVRALLRDLEAAGQIRRSGQRRGTRWHLITDEDRVAARAAEIAAQSRRRTPRQTA